MRQANGDASARRAKRKEVVLKALQCLGLLKLFLRARERTLAARSSGNENRPATDGLPVPQAVLRMRVAGTGDFDWFLESGARAAAGIRSALSRYGAAPEQINGILDFGCGCGRVVRRWAGVSGVHGCDLSAEAVAWCRANLGFAQFATNGPEPPLRYAGESFDFVYALSVFTHLAGCQQHAWMRELHRVLRPDGLLLITTHGIGFVDHLSTSERERYDAGNLVVRWKGVAGSNMCSAFHPEPYLRGPFSSGFELLEFKPEGAAGNPPQDQILLRKSTPR
ncbi:MAG: class I SAM-dependent methyltransferase [Terriglobia bacterium]